MISDEIHTDHSTKNTSKSSSAQQVYENADASKSADSISSKYSFLDPPLKLRLAIYGHLQNTCTEEQEVESRSTSGLAPTPVTETSSRDIIKNELPNVQADDSEHKGSVHAERRRRGRGSSDETRSRDIVETELPNVLKDNFEYKGSIHAERKRRGGGSSDALRAVYISDDKAGVQGKDALIDRLKSRRAVQGSFRPRCYSAGQAFRDSGRLYTLLLESHTSEFSCALRRMLLWPEGCYHDGRIASTPAEARNGAGRDIEAHLKVRKT